MGNKAAIPSPVFTTAQEDVLVDWFPDWPLFYNQHDTKFKNCQKMDRQKTAPSSNCQDPTSGTGSSSSTTLWEIVPTCTWENWAGARVTHSQTAMDLKVLQLPGCTSEGAFIEPNARQC